MTRMPLKVQDWGVVVPQKENSSNERRFLEGARTLAGIA